MAKAPRFSPLDLGVGMGRLVLEGLSMEAVGSIQLSWIAILRSFIALPSNWKSSFLIANLQKLEKVCACVSIHVLAEVLVPQHFEAEFMEH